MKTARSLEKLAKKEPEVRFVIDEDYLIGHLLYAIKAMGLSSKKFNKDIIALRDYACNNASAQYRLLTKKGDVLLRPIAVGKNNSAKTINGLQSYLGYIKKSEQYKRVLKQTRGYLKFCQSSWKEQLRKSSRIINGISGLKFNRQYIVYITHPSLRNGRYLGNNRLTFGHNEDFKNYSVIYIWHEIMHSKLPSNDIGHAILEFAVDEELRTQLNGGGYPPFEGHPGLSKVKLKLLPYWRKYLTSKNRKIIPFYKTIAKMPQFETYLKRFRV